MFDYFWPVKKTPFDKVLLNDLYRYALSFTHDEQQAYDLLQSTCEKVLSQNIAAKQLKAYMIRMIRNAYIDQYRRKKLELVVDQRLSEQHLIERTVTSELEQIIIDQQHVSIILQSLNPHERELLYLWAVEGKTVQELATQTNTSRGTLLARLHRLKKRLKQEYSHLIERVS